MQDIIGVISCIVAIVAAAVAVYAYLLNRNQFRFAVMISCIDRFQKIIPGVRSRIEQDREKAVRQYIDLCNEELFYFQKNYLPDEVIDEWLDGMIQYLPHFNEKGDNLNPNCIPEIIEQDLLADYPRIRRAFTVNEQYDLKNDSRRRALISLIRENLKQKPTSTQSLQLAVELE
jgi:hypothetical protein